jgi:hypothetical protein
MSGSFSLIIAEEDNENDVRDDLHYRVLKEAGLDDKC